MAKEVRTNLHISGVENSTDADNDLVTKGWVKQHIAEAIESATKTLKEELTIALAGVVNDAIAEALAELADEPLIIVPPKNTYEPEKIVSNRNEFLDAVTMIKTGRGEEGSDGMNRIRLKNNIDLTGQFETIIDGLSSAIIDGSGFKFTRSNHQIRFSMFNMIRLTDVTFQNVGFDDGADGVAGPMRTTKRMVWVRNSKNVKFDNVYVANSKGYAVYIQAVHGFDFVNSEMERAGILGLYVGHGDDNQSTGVNIDNNHFHDNSTNAVALLGVSGEVKNYVTNNLFERNHLYGRWAVAPKYGTGFTGGGQLYLAHIDNCWVSGNTIKDGHCLNCIDKSDKKVKNIAGIELSGLYGEVIKVTRLTITDNDVYNNDGKGIAQNINSTLDGTTKIYGNRVHDNGKDFAVHDIPNAA